MGITDSTLWSVPSMELRQAHTLYLSSSKETEIVTWVGKQLLTLKPRRFLEWRSAAVARASTTKTPHHHRHRYRQLRTPFPRLAQTPTPAPTPAASSCRRLKIAKLQ